jgi:hypothetical protein
MQRLWIGAARRAAEPGGDVMHVELNEGQVRLLRAQLEHRIEELEKEAAHTEKHQMQHALALDVDALKEVLGRVDASLASASTSAGRGGGS